MHILKQLAALYMQSGSYYDARQSYQRVRELAPDDRQSQLALVNLEHWAGNEDEALKLLGNLRGEGQADVGPTLVLAALYLKQGNWQAVLQLLDGVEAVAGRDPDYALLLGKAQLEAGAPGQALQTLSPLLQSLPDSAGLWLLLADAYRELDRPVDVRTTLEQVLALQPDNSEALYRLGRLHITQRHPVEALALARRLLQAKPDSLDARRLEGDALLLQGNARGAIDSYQSVFDQAPDSGNLLRLHAALKPSDPAAALSLLERWIATNGDDTNVLMTFGTALVEADRFADAEDIFHRILNSDPDNVLALNNLAWAAYRLSKPDMLHYAEQAYRLNPDSADVADTYGWILVEQGNEAKGLAVLTSALERSPGHTSLRYHRAAALSSVGTPDVARGLLEQLLATPAGFDERPMAEALLLQLATAAPGAGATTGTPIEPTARRDDPGTVARIDPEPGVSAPVAVESGEHLSPVPLHMVVNSTTLRLRNQPGANARTLALLSRGTVVEIVDGNGDWLGVKTPRDGKGWVHADYLADISDAPGN